MAGSLGEPTCSWRHSISASWNLPACMSSTACRARSSLPVQWDGCSQQDKPAQSSNPQPQERDIHERLHAYRIITEADRDWKGHAA
jgi:hypothetical protein